MPLSDAWGVEDPIDPTTISLRSVRPTLIARARKREVRDTSKKNAWLVMGNPSLGDEYDHYEVFDSDGWLCTCQIHKYGEARKVCSHIVAVMLHLEGDSDEDGENGESSESGNQGESRREEGGSKKWELKWEKIDVPVPVKVPVKSPVRERGSYPLSDPAPPEEEEVEEEVGAIATPPSPPSSSISERDWDLLVGNKIDRRTVISIPGETWHNYETDNPPPMQHAMFGDPPFPEDFTTFREDQWRAIREILEALEDGYRVVMLSAPTGSGKTIVGEAVRRLWVGPHPATFMCSTKTLQDQIERDFPYAVVLKGKDNYPTLDDPERNCGDCAVQKVVGPACVRCRPDSGQGESYFSQMHEGIEYQHCTFCVVGGTITAGPTVEKVMRRWYEGDLVEITTALGHQLAGTPNHPILTDRGWVDLGDLQETDRVVSSRLGEEMSSRDPHIQYGPTEISEMFRATAVAATVGNQGVPGVDMNFDSKGIEPQVYVVSPNSLLLDGVEATESQPVGQEDLAGTNGAEGPLFAESSMVEFLEGSGSATNSSMSGSSLGSEFLWGSEGEAESLGLSMGADGNPRLIEPSLHDILRYPEISRQFPNGFPVGVTLDQVVEVRRFKFAGHVFNLQTTDGWYLANRIVTHNCHPVNQCPYRVAKRAAIDAPLSVLNYAYWMAESRGPAKFAGRPFVIADEADMLEEELMRQIEVQLTPGERKKLGIHTLPKKTVPADWVRWITEDVIPAYNRDLATLTAQLNQQSMMDPDPKLVRRQKRSKMRRDRFMELVKPSPYVVAEPGAPVPTLIEDGWVLTGYESNDYTEAYLTWKPIRVDTMADDYLFSHALQWLLMSATLVSPEQMAEDLGLDDDEWTVVEMDSTFPVGRRPIYANQANIPMTHKTKETAWPQMVRMVDRCIEEHPGKRILVHTVSYALTKELMNRSKHGDRVMTYWNAAERGVALDRFLSVDDAVLLAPSFERGVDLPGEDCEVIIVAKMPYPYIGDKQVAARMYGRGGKQWYAVATIRSICQMTGRGMRSKNDWCETYIFDGQFRKLYREWKRLFPKWWRDAVVLDLNDPKTRRMLEEI